MVNKIFFSMSNEKNSWFATPLRTKESGGDNGIIAFYDAGFRMNFNLLVSRIVYYSTSIAVAHLTLLITPAG